MSSDENSRTKVQNVVANSTAKSHIRIGTFQWFAAREDYGNLKVLADNVIDRHYPEAQREENPVSYTHMTPPTNHSL